MASGLPRRVKLQSKLEARTGSVAGDEENGDDGVILPRISARCADHRFGNGL